uniref:transposase n=1 Tax=Pedobacter lusitanus TaxID=1503925 RepID=UPI0009E512FA
MRLTNYFDFPIEIRKIIYTTNVIESLNSGIRKFTKSKNLSPDDQAALKAVYLSVMQQDGLLYSIFKSLKQDKNVSH